MRNLVVSFGVAIPLLVAADAAESPADSKSFVDASNQFAFDLYSKLPRKDDDNILFSPFSVWSALAMLNEGAKGATAKEISTTLHLPTEAGSWKQSLSECSARLQREDAKARVCVANALWIQKGYPLNPGFDAVIRKSFGGQVESVDFGKADAAAKIVNAWASKQTDGKIPQVISAADIDVLTRLILANAIYFKGLWVSKFDPKATHDADFRITKERKVTVPFMRKTTAVYYAEDNQAQCVEIPYEGGELAMGIFLPRKDNLMEFEKSLDAKKLAAWRKRMDSHTVSLLMPRCHMETDYEMIPCLKDLGMPLAFTSPPLSPHADFSGISKAEELMVARVIHKAVMDVDEGGTEAAAVTVILMEAGGAPPKDYKPPPIPEFRADHPFLFWIVESKSGCILFMGRVQNPSSAEKK